jgi:transketolase
MGRLAVPVIFNDDYKFEIGKANVLRKGKDVSIIANGLMTAEALKAAEELAEEGIQATVVNCASVKPLDAATIIEVARETGAVVTAEEHNIIGGLGSAVSEVLGENCPVPMQRVGLKDTFGESGKPEELLSKYELTKDAVIKSVKAVLGRK